ncbi:hypothetical protein XMD517_001362 [Aliiroseovarius sp. xm-d-517]|nr:hypothetical protein [Aliiroseovarius sp. xm-d-517]NRP42546.1 hypothetical protein [Aliiroseovarius sp. xm-m-339-2]NRP63458.1 hypothetical protein [Aliiroseovarius sp. xm-a-151]
MSLYEASLKTTDPKTGSTHLNRLLTMRASNPAQVALKVAGLGLTKDSQGELIIYQF